MKILLLLFFPITLLSQINIDKIEIPELKNKDTFINCEELQKKHLLFSTLRFLEIH
jgi:hypothetical protein